MQHALVTETLNHQTSEQEEIFLKWNRLTFELIFENPSDNVPRILIAARSN